MLIRTLISLSLLIIISTVSSTVFAQKMDFSLSSDSARISYTTLSGSTTFGRTEISGGFLYNEDGNTMLDLGMQVVDMAGTKTPGLEIGIGPRLYYASLDTPSASGLSLALGGNLRYKSPDLDRMAFYGTLYYAPDITSFMDSDGMFEFGIRAAYEILPTADAYIGYQRIRMDVNKGGAGNQTLDDGIIFGINMNL